MAGLPPGDPQLVSMIVNHLKTQGLFDQFRRDCLADVDTKPAYLNLKQRVDNFVSNHLSNHTWSPHLNKNQLRNNIRQLVLQSGMLEQGVDRIVAQVVDPKVNHIFRPQVERVVREFLSPGSCSEEPLAPLPTGETKPDSSLPEQASTSAPAATAASDAMSILDTITSLNQEANVKATSDTEKGRKGTALDEPMQLVEENEQDMNVTEEGDRHHDGGIVEEETKVASEIQVLEVKLEDTQEQMDLGKEELIEEVKMEDEEFEAEEQTEEEKDNTTSRITGKSPEEKQDDGLQKSSSQAKQKAKDRIKEEYSLDDSDLEGLSDITVSSVHTSDLSSFEGESEVDKLLSDSSEEGELRHEDQSEMAEKKYASGDASEEERKPRRKAYVHKPFLYSRYYSDSDDEITVEERRRSAAKDKEERLLKRQQNRERMEEKRKQKALQATEEEQKKREKSGDSAGLDRPRAKEARKERKVLEKKMALNRKRKLDSKKEGDVASRKKGDTGGEGAKKVEVKLTTSKTPQPKPMRNLSESAPSEERNRRTSGSFSEDSSETKKLFDKGRTHSFILELEQGSQEALKIRSSGKFDRLSRKDLHSKERKEKDSSVSDERARTKQKQEKKSEQADESQHKDAVKALSEEKGEKKPKLKSEKKMLGNTREGKASVSEGVADEGPRDAKKVKGPSIEAVKAEKDKQKDKFRDKDKCKEKAKGEKTSAKSDFKQLFRPDSACSSEDRSDLEPGPENSKKKNKHSKEVLKRSKSHTEDRHGDKPKSTTDSKDSEKEKTKPDQDSQKSNKSNSEADKDPKRVKTTEKGRTMEKSKPKVEIKTPLLSKIDKKVNSSEVKGAGGATKERKKEGNIKEHRKATEEPSHERSEMKTFKKKTDNKDDNQEEKKAPREDKPEKSDKSSKSSVSSLSLEMEEPPKRLLQDVSTDSELVTTTVTTSFSDDTCDALSDITPEPPEGEIESQLSDMHTVPAEANALLTLMDVCTSAEARLPQESIREEVTAEMELQDADMKMKEAALTLLSMDPDSTVSSALISQDSREELELNPPAPQPMETTPAIEEEQCPPETMKMSPAPFQQTTELADGKPNSAEESENSEREKDMSMVERSLAIPPKEDDTISTEHPASLKEDEASMTEMAPETQTDEKVASPATPKEAADAAVSEIEEVRESTEESGMFVVSEISEPVLEMSSKQDQEEPDLSDTKINPEAMGIAAEENQARKDMDDDDESKRQVQENIEAVKSDPQTVESSGAEAMDEVRESDPECQSKLVKQISNISSTGSHEEEKGSDQGSEKEEKTEGRGRRKRKLSSQKVAAVKESGDERIEKEIKEQTSVEQTVQEKVTEVKTPRRGRLSRSTQEPEKDQTKEPEKPEETSSRKGRRSGAGPKEAAADHQKKDETKEEEGAEKTSSDEPSEMLLNTAEKIVSEDCEDAGGSTDICKPAVKRKRSEDMEENVEETQVKKEEDNSQQEQNEQQCEKDSVIQTEGQEDDKDETCTKKKLDNAEEEQQQEDQDVSPKKNARRGRPPKAAAATEDTDKKDKKAEGKESEHNDEEEEDEGEEKGTATRATTRAASRLEAERNKPSKPSTRASRQSGKEETAAGTRGSRGPATVGKGGRKREASPPAVRTRGGQKLEEPPSKRAKR